MTYPNHKFRVFLCHASQDKPIVRELYQQLLSEEWIDPWLDEEKLLPGQDWNLEIEKAVESSDLILVCLSNQSVSKEGYIQKELRLVLDITLTMPEGKIFLIPLKLEECDIPRRLQTWQWVNYFPHANRLSGYQKILASIKTCAESSNLYGAKPPLKSVEQTVEKKAQKGEIGIHDFINIPAQKNSGVDYPFAIGKYPVTNVQYERFLTSSDFANPLYWLEFPKFDYDNNRDGHWGKEGYDWLEVALKERNVELKERNPSALLPNFWDDKELGKSQPLNPVVAISWYEACAYCEWLFENWNKLEECNANPNLQPQEIRLPLQVEWETAAGGKEPYARFPWDEVGKVTDSLKEIIRRANVEESRIKHTTPVNSYPLGISPNGVMDMAGNVYELLVNYLGGTGDNFPWRSSVGGSYFHHSGEARANRGAGRAPNDRFPMFGFRVVIIPMPPR